MMSFDRQTSFFIMCMVSPFLITSIIHFNAYGDGCCYSSLTESPASKTMHPSIKFEPHFLYLESTQERYVQIKFLDANTYTPIKNVQFFLNVTKGDQKLMYDLFYTKDGTIRLNFEPGETIGKWTVYGDKEPIMDGWYSQTGQLNVTAPILSEEGLYHFNIEILGFGYPNMLIPHSEAKINFDEYVIVRTHLPPLIQIKNGTPLSQVKCNDEFILVTKSE